MHQLSSNNDARTPALELAGSASLSRSSRSFGNFEEGGGGAETRGRIKLVLQQELESLLQTHEGQLFLHRNRQVSLSTSPFSECSVPLII